MRKNLIAAMFLAGTVMASPAFASVPVTSDLDTWKALTPGWLEDTEYGSGSTTSVTLDGGPTMTFDQSVGIPSIGSGWATWCCGYTGDVLSVSSNSITTTFNTAVNNFGFYAEPNDFSSFLVTLTTGDGAVLNQLVTGQAGAKFFGWNGGPITSFTVSAAPGANGFAFGDFFYEGVSGAVPEPATWAMMISGFGLVGGAMRRSRSTRVSYSHA
ncbi:PEP-CTERM protein-sorting domain-containing protein [Sphingomonas laterariae]|uniref:PEP-CTERM protein-sorting domain-containing protein n=1 Tax=Edaphosphingomonas laterariae TaxID=861865 RepID=A0A239EPQ8_9SPHN|nr:PEPxxWA-CTERM sorting domain-containing protein [Sphingomonas laterariae]SNS46228.1 PEP-CTERM protein-sorting domain-containing protein [Sphingomonas laterariae]